PLRRPPPAERGVAPRARVARLHVHARRAVRAYRADAPGLRAALGEFRETALTRRRQVSGTRKHAAYEELWARDRASARRALPRRRRASASAAAITSADVGVATPTTEHGTPAAGGRTSWPCTTVVALRPASDVVTVIVWLPS